MSIQPFKDFVRSLTELADRNAREECMLSAAQPLMMDLLQNDCWLPDDFARADPEKYTQYLLHCDPLERFSIVSFVWGPGHETPIHDHTVWGLLGVLRGCEISQRYIEGDGGLHTQGGLEYLESGAIDMVSPTIGDIHKVWNGMKERASVSIHVYGGNIGRISRHAFGNDGSRKDFVSGYSSPVIPNIWCR
ncbi:cysteine dioxygenase [Mesorhizobium sp. CA8]|uniref:cysteine dioxygenase family protein n=1 Tax=unclassified Mesorhizobium TaxID=325217 RepID=UPI001CCC187D|nr:MULTISPECIES: cysteine dioxygenase [unclassified Mesorhizobium]MBZ9761780.1 cysteine dioxygenase [Mesorhizobium sp. CA8]MBZ9823308.1 cysteine dioxygenase [Mesorhizobium sp. CA4]